MDVASTGETLNAHIILVRRCLPKFSLGRKEKRCITLRPIQKTYYEARKWNKLAHSPVQLLDAGLILEV
jgi:hypothetical protein